MAFPPLYLWTLAEPYWQPVASAVAVAHEAEPMKAAVQLLFAAVEVEKGQAFVQ